MKQSDVTIIIPHLGATKEQHYALRECLISLRQTAPDIKIIVAKNGREYMGEPIPNDFYEYASKVALSEQGQCKAVNAAIATTNTPWVMISNDDMIYPPHWFEKLTTGGGGTRGVAADDPWIMCLSPMLVEPRPGAPTFETYFCGGAGGDFDKQKWIDFANEHAPRVQPLRTGFNFPLLLKRELWDTIGGYDINYDPWGSNGDSDLEYKIMLAGIQPYQNTNCIVYHFSQTSGTFEPKNDAHRFRNYAYFKEKWGFERTDEGIWQASFRMPSSLDGRIYRPWWEGKYNG